MEYISKESTIDIESALKGECIDSFGAEPCKYIKENDESNNSTK